MFLAPLLHAEHQSRQKRSPPPAPLFYDHFTEDDAAEENIHDQRIHWDSE